MFSIKSILQVALNVVLAVTIILVAPGIPPNIKFESYTVTPPLELTGKLAPNSILNNVKVLTEEVHGPESVSLRGDEIFVGDNRGKIVKIKNGKVSTVAEFAFKCGPEESIYKDKCSWPLATRFDNTGKLIVTDPYYGIIRLDVDTGSWETLVTINTIIKGKPVGFPEDIDVAKNGEIYWTDGTSVGIAESTWNEFIGSSGSGRLLKYNPKTNSSEVLLDNLHFANGVQLSKNEDFVLVAETPRGRLTKYHLKGDRKGQSEIFLDGLPGMPDNIRPNGKGGFYVTCFSLRPKSTLENPLVRKLFLRTRFISQYLASLLHSIYPSESTKSIYEYARTLGPLFHFKIEEPKNAFIVEVNENGEIIKSLQSTNGAIYGLSQITIGEKYSYLAGPLGKQIWYIETKKLQD